MAAVSSALVRPPESCRPVVSPRKRSLKKLSACLLPYNATDKRTPQTQALDLFTPCSPDFCCLGIKGGYENCAMPPQR
jgi:hypothetical protein